MASAFDHNYIGVQHLSVSQETAGQRLDNFLFTYLKGVPRTRIYRIVRKGEVRVNKGRVKPDYRLMAGDTLRIPPLYRESETTQPIIPQKVEQSLLEHILFEDNDVIVLNKPAGLAVHGGSGLSFGVIEALRILKPEIEHLELVHRLDRETSGCLLIAKKKSVLRFLHDQIKQNCIEKNYTALVRGDWQAGNAVDVPLRKNQLSSGERIVRVHEEGKEARTEYEVLKRFGMATLMSITLITGRTHQIRVHSQYVGHPIAFDPKYGDAAFDRLMKQYGLNRLFLHASRICFELPNTGKLKTFEAPMDENLLAVVQQLEEKSHV